jgi:hypothetical protein
MRKLLLIITLSAFVSASSHAQLGLTKLLGKYSSTTKLGFNLFAHYDFPLNEDGNRRFKLELIDFSFYPPNNSDVDDSKAYLAIKLGYKYIFSEDQTGFYLEPQLGWCRTSAYFYNSTAATYKDGIAAALQTGYNLEVGQRGNAFDFGLKYESDMAGSDYTLGSISFRISYSFNLFRKRDSY